MSTGLDRDTAEQLTASLHAVFTAAPEHPETALTDLGWDDVRAADPVAATRLLFTAHGRALATSRLLDGVVLDEIPPVSAARRAVLYPYPDGGGLPGRRGVLLGPLDGIDEVVVLTEYAAPVRLPADAVARAAAPASGFDRTSRWLVVDEVPWPDTTPPAGPPPDRAIAAARRALAAELIGVTDSALSLAVEHTTSRTQFGRPIGSFQAVRHRLAEAYVALEAARSTLDAAEADGTPWSAALAKRAAGLAQAGTLRTAVQVCGAMGVAGEGPVHAYVARGAALDALLGGHRSLTASLGAALLSGAELHPVVTMEDA
ncbi:acyl-CoA dehydrogenase family protein [Cryptosporangium aurantiacum]|uniref:Acyl-CoA dehydrogenase, C-terminal domain n=1 Tax=Cryptosporangium aurantiacum TaxID=134849 RepID=A0A1M7PMV7_9ACTN|nr:acyl-CoA dehydrogenase family protein [Cryptosporangium aurantiacum]SHN18653.1 Acyl-CoA dehydrogenase, C-terminal domain [Cryptosporangium aurantiacum]